MTKKKVYQCQCCTNKSNEGAGILTLTWKKGERMWICMPCYEAFRSEKARAEGE